MAIVDAKKVADDLVGSILDVENGSVRVFHADSPSLHLGDGIEDRIIAAGGGGLLRDGLGESLTHVAGWI